MTNNSLSQIKQRGYWYHTIRINSNSWINLGYESRYSNKPTFWKGFVGLKKVIKVGIMKCFIVYVNEAKLIDFWNKEDMSKYG